MRRKGCYFCLYCLLTKPMSYKFWSRTFVEELIALDYVTNRIPCSRTEDILKRKIQLRKHALLYDQKHNIVYA